MPAGHDGRPARRRPRGHGVCRCGARRAAPGCAVPPIHAPSLRAMLTIDEIMTRNVQLIGSRESLAHAARLMDDLNIGALPVCDGRKLVGMLTDRDITVRAVAAGLDPRKTSVAEAMTARVRWCSPHESVDAVARQMSATQIRRMPRRRHRLARRPGDAPARAGRLRPGGRRAARHLLAVAARPLKARRSGPAASRAVPESLSRYISDISAHPAR